MPDSTLVSITSPISFAYRIVTFCDRPFQAVQLELDCSLVPIKGRRDRNTLVHAPGFRLFRFRSPLLTESQLISFPLGTEMFHFPRLPTDCYQPDCSSSLQLVDTSYDVTGFPIRTSTDQRQLAPPRGLSQLATSFFDF